MKYARDLVGQRFGRLVVLLRAANHGRAVYWLCRCDCGTEREIWGYSLTTGRSVSCGCYNREMLSSWRTTHGESIYGSKHSPEYRAWLGMKQRCLNPNDKSYANYGGRGITMSVRWRDSYEHFLADMGRRPSAEHSLDRIDNNGPYSKNNCRWATRSQQQTNKRRWAGRNAKSPIVIRRLQRAGIL